MNEDRMNQLKKILDQLENENRGLRMEKEQQRIALNQINSTNEDLRNQLNEIYSSNGWRYLSKYYRFRDRLVLSGLKWRISKKEAALEIGVENTSILKVSLIIPVYNNYDYLKECLTSAVLQTYPELEIIAVDDHSSDERVAPLLQSFEKYPHFRHLKNEFNMGISETMNNAIIAAKGDWIAFLDCDDWLDQNAIEVMVNYIQKKDGAVYAYSDRINEIEASGESIGETFINRPNENYLDNLMTGMYTSHLKLIHKKVFLKVGLHESRFDGAQDYDMALKTAFHFGDAFVHVPEAVYHHRIHIKQTTQEAATRINERVSAMRAETDLRRKIRSGRFNKKVSFLILSFEKMEMTLQCVQSIQRTVNIPYEIIVFDNASSQETKAYLKKYVEPLSNVKMVYSAENLGCPGGRRAVTKMATGDYIINLDNDIIVTDGWLEELIIRADCNANVGAVCCRTVFPNGEVQFNGGKYFINDDFISFSLIDTGKNEKDLSSLKWLECDWVPGGATLFKREAVESVDYSEGYINAFEDNDVALQLSRKGFKLLNCPSSKVYHYHIIHDEKQVKKEKDYMRVRYNNDGFIQSLLNFYLRNSLIIHDEFVFRLMGISQLERSKIKERIKELCLIEYGTSKL